VDVPAESAEEEEEESEAVLNRGVRAGRVAQPLPPEIRPPHSDLRDDGNLPLGDRRVADDGVWGLRDAAGVDADGLLRTVGLAGMEERETSTLSGGELQRLAVAAALFVAWLGWLGYLAATGTDKAHEQAFVAGVFPLAIATGAGARSRVAIGTAVMGGMIAATLLASVPIYTRALADLGLSFAIREKLQATPSTDVEASPIPFASPGGLAFQKQIAARIQQRIGWSTAPYC